MPKPFLSIGIIFKNEIRCLERCLSSLTPLREAIPCELVMADTGSTDGSHEVAEKYADTLIDFPWVNDFSAARNAVMDQCSGRWYLSIDADEWFDENFKELVEFLRSNNRKNLDCCTVVIRNYLSLGDEPDYSDFFAVRMLRMSTGLRYQGAIHEMWRYDDDRTIHSINLSKTLLHHDGYVGLNEEAGEAKRRRNLIPLREKLEEDPENVRALLQYLESSRPDADHIEYVKRAIAATEAKRPEWEAFGPVIFRQAVVDAWEQEMPELEEWIARAETLFPDSFYIKIDIAYVACLRSYRKENYAQCIQSGERYLNAIADYRAGRGDQSALLFSTLQAAHPKWERSMRIMLATSYLKVGQAECGAEILESVEFSAMDAGQVHNCTLFLKELHTETSLDTAPLIKRFFTEICQPVPSAARAEERRDSFIRELMGSFSMGTIRKEERSGKSGRYSCTLAAPLAGQCDLGDAAAVMAAETVQEKERVLSAVEKPYDMPREVLRRALAAGVSFPLPQKPMSLEEIDALADRLARRDGLDILDQSVKELDGNAQQLAWVRGVAIAIVTSWDWEDEKQGLEIAKSFAKIEGAYIARCYTPEMLCDENILLLPPMHRFGWYCCRAFQALDAGDATKYVRLLRAGLDACPQMKAMVEFLTEHTPQLKPPVSGELLALAEKVRAMLAAYPADDPAVAMLKQSAAYQKVAHLIEGPEPGLFGGLKQ